MKEKKPKMWRCPRCERETVKLEEYGLLRCTVCRWNANAWHKDGQEILHILEDAISPARRLVRLACEEQGRGYGRSNLRHDHAHDGALRLAIGTLMDFYLSDFEVLGRREEWYSLACEGPHGTNLAAVRAFEHAAGRKPFILKSSDHPAGERLHVGSLLGWELMPEGSARLKVTSFAPDGQSLVACSYYQDSPAAYEECPTCGRSHYKGQARAPKKRVRITLEDLAAYN